MAVNPDFQGGNVTDDPVVNEVIDIVCKRHMQGMNKFGITMDENERPFDQWIGELIEELLDAVHYAIKAKKIIEKFKAKEKSLEAMLETFKKETFVEEQKPLEDSLKAFPEGYKQPEPDQPQDKEKINSENWYETQGVQPPPAGDTNDKNKEEEST